MWRQKDSVPVFRELVVWWKSQTSKSIMTALYEADGEPDCPGSCWNTTPPTSHPCKRSPAFWENFLEQVMSGLSLEAEVRVVWGRAGRIVPG